MENEFVGYHGTVKDNISSIMSNGFNIKRYSFVSSQLQDIPGDLGAGVYAYHDSKENALAFAKKFGNDTTVLELSLSVDKEKFLDMDKKINSRLILELYKSPTFMHLKSRYERGKGGRGRECLDGLILEHIINKHGLKVDLVKKETYTRFKDLPLTSHYHNGVELCIRNNDVIKEISEVK